MNFKNPFRRKAVLSLKDTTNKREKALIRKISTVGHLRLHLSSKSKFRIVENCTFSPPAVTLELIDYPGHVMRARGMQLLGEKKSHDQEFIDESTFYLMSNLWFDGFIAFESTKSAAHYIRLRGNELQLSRYNGVSIFKEECSFKMTSSNSTTGKESMFQNDWFEENGNVGLKLNSGPSTSQASTPYISSNKYLMIPMSEPDAKNPHANRHENQHEHRIENRNENRNTWQDRNRCRSFNVKERRKKSLAISDKHGTNVSWSSQLVRKFQNDGYEDSPNFCQKPLSSCLKDDARQFQDSDLSSATTTTVMLGCQQYKKPSSFIKGEYSIEESDSENDSEARTLAEESPNLKRRPSRRQCSQRRKNAEYKIEREALEMRGLHGMETRYNENGICNGTHIRTTDLVGGLQNGVSNSDNTTRKESGSHLASVQVNGCSRHQNTVKKKSLIISNEFEEKNNSSSSADGIRSDIRTEGEKALIRRSVFKKRHSCFSVNNGQIRDMENFRLNTNTGPDRKTKSVCLNPNYGQERELENVRSNTDNGHGLISDSASFNPNYGQDRLTVNPCFDPSDGHGRKKGSLSFSPNHGQDTECFISNNLSDSTLKSVDIKGNQEASIKINPYLSYIESLSDDSECWEDTSAAKQVSQNKSIIHKEDDRGLPIYDSSDSEIKSFLPRHDGEKISCNKRDDYYDKVDVEAKYDSETPLEDANLRNDIELDCVDSKSKCLIESNNSHAGIIQDFLPRGSAILPLDDFCSTTTDEDEVPIQNKNKSRHKKKSETHIDSYFATKEDDVYETVFKEEVTASNNNNKINNNNRINNNKKNCIENILPSNCNLANGSLHTKSRTKMAQRCKNGTVDDNLGPQAKMDTYSSKMSGTSDAVAMKKCNNTEDELFLVCLPDDFELKLEEREHKERMDQLRFSKEERVDSGVSLSPKSPRKENLPKNV